MPAEKYNQNWKIDWLDSNTGGAYSKKEPYYFLFVGMDDGAVIWDFPKLVPKHIKTRVQAGWTHRKETYGFKGETYE